MSDLPIGWKRYSIGSLCELINGRAFKPSDWSETGLPIVRIQNLNNSDARFNRFSGEVRPRFRIDSGALLFAWSGTPGTSFGTHIWNGGPAVLNQHIFNILFDERKLDKHFLRLAINQKLDELIDKAHGGVGLRHVTKGKFQATEIDLPPLDEQRRIVTKMDRLFNHSRKAREELARLPRLIERCREAIFAAASSGDLTGDWRKNDANIEDASTLLRTIRIALNKTQRSVTPMPEGKYIPKTWVWCRVSDVGDVTLGRQRSPRHHTGTHMRPYLRVANVFENRIDTRDVMEMNFTPTEYKRFKLERGDILLNEGQSKELIGRPAMFMGELEDVCFTNTLVRFRAFPPVSAAYALLIFRHYFRSGLFRSIANTTTNISHLGAGRFADLPFPLPPLAEQIEIVKRCSLKVDAVEKIHAHISKALAQIERLDQATLAKAFRGEFAGLQKFAVPMPSPKGAASNG